jgi:4-aminobutyrate aminotransferase-like enzyme
MVVSECLKRGILINATGDRVLRFVPPLIITQHEIDRMVEVLSRTFNKLAAAAPVH